MNFVEDILFYIISDKIIQLQPFIKLIRSLKADSVEHLSNLVLIIFIETVNPNQLRR